MHTDAIAAWFIPCFAAFFTIEYIVLQIVFVSKRKGENNDGE